MVNLKWVIWEKFREKRVFFERKNWHLEKIPRKIRFFFFQMIVFSALVLENNNNNMTELCKKKT